MSEGFWSFILKYQTLVSASVAATIASIAAYIAFQNTSRTLRHSEQLESNRRIRKHASLRAMLPVALSKIIEYSHRSAAALLKVIIQCSGQSLSIKATFDDLPQRLPDETLELLAEFIEYSDHIDVSLLETMVAWIQIHNSRVVGYIRDNEDPSGTSHVLQINLEGAVIDAASIYATAAAGFDYARRLQDSMPTTVMWDDVRGALKNMHIWDHDHPQIYKIIDGREKSSTGPFDKLAP